MLLVINFGSQVAHLISRRVRDLGVNSAIFPHTVKASQIKKINPKGIIFSGGPASVYSKSSPQVDPKIFELGIPVLGICYGLQLIGKKFGKVDIKEIREYGKAKIKINEKANLLSGLSKNETVWMSHGDSITKLPGFKILASSKTCKFAAVENQSKKIYGLQFHPEVVHTVKGKKILQNFIFKICNSAKDYNLSDLKKNIISEIKKTVGSEQVLMGVSGGVDSTVASLLIHKAIGNRLHCVFIDHGLIRKGEKKEVDETYKKLHFKNYYSVDASKVFLNNLKGVKDPEKKRKIIGHTFIRVFEKKAKQISKKNKIKFLGQGTIYPDRIESADGSNTASKIKSHHNLTLPKNMNLKIIEPLKDLYKDGVRDLGTKIGISKELLNRHPFPGPGLAIRVLGEITQNKLKMLRDADYIFIEELKKSGYYSKTWQALAALLPVRSVGVMGDARTYDFMITLRCVTSIDAMTADWAKLPLPLLEIISSRIVNEVRGVNRVVYDITQKPPGTIEYE